MASSSLVVAKKDEDSFPFLTDQLPSYDFRENGFASMEWQSETSIQESYFDAFPLMGSVPDPPLYPSQDIVTVPEMITHGDMIYASDSDNGGAFIWNELVPLMEPTEAPKPLFLCCKNEEASLQVTTKPQRKLTRKQRLDQEIKLITSSKQLSRETISRYFYMPITKAAKELDVGLTLLKKRCRELDIRRWPHRKLMSIQTLIKNVQEMQREGEGSEGKLREAIEVLERERKLIEERPDIQMDDTTKRLRQACFKANYKKRKLMGMGMSMSMMNMDHMMMMGPVDMVTTSSSLSFDTQYHHQDTATTTTTTTITSAYDEYQITQRADDNLEDLEEMRSFFSSSSSNGILMTSNY